MIIKTILKVVFVYVPAGFFWMLVVSRLMDILVTRKKDKFVQESTYIEKIKKSFDGRNRKMIKKKILFQRCPVPGCGEIMVAVGCCFVACPKKEHSKKYPRYRWVKETNKNHNINSD